MALLLIFILSLVLKRPIRGFGYVFIILFLGTWVGQIWLPAVGPVHFGVAWIPFIFMNILLVFMILALSSTPARNRKEQEAEGPIIVAGFFFWFFILLLLVALIVGYYRTPVIIASI
jgi:small-conductance mechanosensitive channel